MLPAVALLLLSAAARAQQPPVLSDTVLSLEAVMVTAERAETPLAASVSSVSRLTSQQFGRVPQATVADALRQLPGFALVGFDGLGRDAQVMVRGFYGGGEAEYVVVLVDGRPVNDLHRGGIAWDALPLAEVDVIEVVRGGASPLYGDAALGGVVNIITRRREVVPARSRGGTAGSLRVSGGTFGSFRADASAIAGVGEGVLRVRAAGDRTDGFRDHGARSVWHGGAELALAGDERRRVSLFVDGHWRDFAEPGPLAGADVAQDRTASDDFYRFDNTHDRGVRVGTDVTLGDAGRIRTSGTIALEQRSIDAVRTLVLAPQFADTKERELRTQRGVASLQFTLDDVIGGVTDRLIIGADASYGGIDSRYFEVVAGPRAVFRATAGERGELDTSGEGTRAAGALFAHWAVAPLDAMRLSLGARADWLRDGFDTEVPDPGRVTASHSAFSPRAGVNLRYMPHGNAYLNVGRSFKAPTLDQLFDQRRIPVPFPLTTSNSELVPQQGTTIEAGLYQGAELTPSLHGELTVSAYEMKMKDELDFDVATLRYINIGRSRHRGVEAGLRIDGPRRSSTFVNYTLQHVTTEVGEHAGNFIRAIPRTTLSGGVGFTVLDALELGGIATHLRDMYLDDANTIELTAYTRVDMRASCTLRGASIFVDARNVFDARFNATGFPDPAGTGTIYYYPAAGRTLELGVRTSF